MCASDGPPGFARWLLLLAVVSVPLIVRGLYFPFYPGADDAFIHLAIIDSLRETGTWGINPGEDVNLSTSPLFTVFFLLLSFVSSNVLAIGSGLSIAAVALSIYLTFRLASKLIGSFWPALAVAAISAFNVQLWRWTGTFMEATFAYCLVVVNVYVHLAVSEAAPGKNRGRFLLQGVLIGLTTLVRPELVLLPIALILHTWMKDRGAAPSRIGLTAAGALAVLGIYAVWSLSVFGSVLPSTFYAKTESGVVLVNMGVAKQIAQVVLSAFPALFLLLLISALLKKPAQNDDVDERALKTLLWLVPLLGFMFFYFKTPMLQSAGRYFLPFMAAIPLIAIYPLKKMKGRLQSAMIVVAIATQVFASFYLNATRVAPVLANMWGEYVSTMREATRQIKQYCPIDEPVLVYYDIGVVSWEMKGERRIVDGGALASPDMRGLSIDEMIDESKANYLLESLGNPDNTLALPNHELELLWERSFKSHGVESKGKNYTTRLYRIVSP